MVLRHFRTTKWNKKKSNRMFLSCVNFYQRFQVVHSVFLPWHSLETLCFWTEIENCHYTVNVLTICESADKCHTNKMRNESGGVCERARVKRSKASLVCDLSSTLVYCVMQVFFYHYTITSFFHCKMRLFYFSLVSSPLFLCPCHLPMCFFFSI